MRNYWLAAVAAAAIASPAAAHDGAPYIGVDLGVMKPQDTRLSTDVDFGGAIGTRTAAPGLVVNHKTGYDVDLNGGYDFGMFRVEGEIAYKHASTDSVRLDEVLLGNLPDAAGSDTPFTNDNFPLDLNDHVNVLSGMVNGLLDFGDDTWGGFVGAG